MLGLFAAEFKRIFTHAGVVFIIVVGPLFYALLYPLPYKSDIVTKQKIALVDADQSTLSRRVTRMLESTQGISIAYRPSSMQEAKALLEHEKVYGIVLIPKFFERQIYTSTPAHVELYANANYFLIYAAIANATLDVINALGDQIKRHKARFESQRPQEPHLLTLQSIPLYNPSLGYLNYALANALIFILHQTLLMGTGMLTCTPNTRLQASSFLEALGAILVRCLCFMGVYLFYIFLYFGVLFPYYHIHIHANPTTLLAFGAVFLLATASCGVVLGTYISKPIRITQILLLASLPMIFMMGFIWPFELLPSVLQVFLQAVPAYHAISGMVMLNQLGADLSATLTHLSALVVIAFIALLWESFRLTRKG